MKDVGVLKLKHTVNKKCWNSMETSKLILHKSKNSINIQYNNSTREKKKHLTIAKMWSIPSVPGRMNG